MNEVLEQLMKDLGERMEALGEQVSEARLREVVTTQFNALANDQEFVRKMRFGSGDQKIVGSKFARWGLDVGDIEFLFDLMEAQGRRNMGGPSEKLRNTFKAISEAVYLPMEQVREIDRKAIEDMGLNLARYDAARISRYAHDRFSDAAEEQDLGEQKKPHSELRAGVVAVADVCGLVHMIVTML